MKIANFSENETEPSTALGKVARVLDGQHRIAGLDEGLKSGQTVFDLSVTIFVGADISDQAQIFATVNLEQTKVNKSLVYDLYSLAKSRSPQKTCHNIAVALDGDDQSPLCGRIKRLGVTTAGRQLETITQATFVESLMKYITDQPLADRDNILRGRRLPEVGGDDIRKLPLRNLFIQEKDVEIAQILNNYFLAVKEKWPGAWGEFGRGSVLNRTNGFRALMRFFGWAYLHIAAPGQIPQPGDFSRRVFSRIALKDSDFNTENFPPGSSGEARLYRVLKNEEKL